MDHPLLERLRRGPLLCDGAMGTLLYSRGVPYTACFEEQNLTNQALVQEIHRDYLIAGAEMIETNTFGATRLKLAAHGLDHKVREINMQGARCAREAREVLGVPAFVAGSVGSLGRPLHPLGDLTLEQAAVIFREQIEALLEGGVDALIIETFADLREITVAVETARAACDLPIIAQMTFGEDNRTATGVTPEEAARALTMLDVDVLGVNCAMGPLYTREVLVAMATATDKWLSVQPNAGLPGNIDGRFMYFTTPPYMADYTREFLDMGARIVGGCCGTTPAHIRAMAGAYRAWCEGHAAPVSVAVVEPLPRPVEEDKPPPAAHPDASPLSRKLGRQFVISAEVDPPKGLNPEKILAGALLLKEAGVDCINVADSPMARVRMSCLAAAALIQDRVGVETILHFTTRDRNVMALQAELLGAHATGIRNVLALTGDPPRLGEYPNATAVYDVDSIGLIRIIKLMNEGKDGLGNSIGQPAAFTIACALNGTADDLDHELERFKRKLDAGANFVMSQPLYDLDTLEALLERTGPFDVPFLMGVLPLQSAKHTEFLHNEVPGITIPDAIRERMRQAGEHGREEGVAIAREFLAEARRLVDGVYLMPSFGRYEVCAQIVRDLRAAE